MSDQKEMKLYVAGLHCSSCEILIEKKLLQDSRIAAVDVTRADGSVNIVLTGQQKPTPDELNLQFKDLDYRFAYQPTASSTVKKPIFLKVVLTALIFLVLFFILDKLQFGRLVSVDSKSSLGAFWFLGLVAGLSSCAALVGGLLLSLVKQWHEIYIDSDKPNQKAQPHILFHIGRLAAFFVGGGILGLIGDQISLANSTVYSVFIIVISIIMLILALQMLEISWAQKIRISLPKSIVRLAADPQALSGKYVPFLIGALTFILPCGFTLVAQSVALTTGSFWVGGLVMLAFALGTLPVLLTISWTGLQFTKKPAATAKFSHVAGLIIIFFVLYNINGQLNVFGYPSLSDINFINKPVTSLYSDNQDVDPQQTITLIARGFEYLPTTPTTLKAGRPTKLIVDNQGISGCGSYVAARGLFGGYVALKPGKNIIDLGNPKAGSYKITCSMGMVPPVTVTFK